MDKHNIPEEAIRRQIDDTFDARGIHFSDTMRAQVTERLEHASRKAAHQIAGKRSSLWNRKIAVPVPLLFLPVAVLIAVGAVAIHASLGTANHSEYRTVITQDGSMYSAAQLSAKETES